MGMSKKELQIVSILVEAVELLKASRAGHCDAASRVQNRNKANELMASLPKNWFKSVDESWANELARWA